MTGIYLGTSFSLLVVMLVSAVIFVYTWLRSHDISRITYPHPDSRSGDEGGD